MYTVFFFNDTATTEIYTLSLHDALPISYRADMTYFNLAGVNDGGMTGVVLPVNGFNILHELENTSKEANKTTLGANLRLTYDLFDGFQLQGLASYSHDANNSDTVIGADTYTAFNDRLWFDEQVLNWTPYGSILQSNSRGDSYNARLQLNYHKLMAEVHDVALYAGAEIRGNHKIGRASCRERV